MSRLPQRAPMNRTSRSAASRGSRTPTRALELGAEFIGLNFYAAQPAVDRRRASGAARRHVGDRARVVGVFVNHDARRGGAHRGARSASTSCSSTATRARRARAARRARDQGVARRAARCRTTSSRAIPRAWGFLFDSARARRSPARCAPARELRRHRQPWSWDSAGSLPARRPVFVAGGIRPDNVARAVGPPLAVGHRRQLGRRSAPGRKDPALLERLFEEIAHGQIASAS